MSGAVLATERPELTAWQRYVVLIAAFLGWMFAGLQISLFVIIHRPAMVSLMTGGTSSGPINEAAVAEWFAWYQTAFLLGAACGGWLFGLLGDRYGRTKSLAWSVLCYSLFTGLCYFANSPVELLVLRFLLCLGIGGAWPNTVALVAEAWPAASRPFLAGLLGTAANVGQVVIGVIGYYIDITPESWRWVFLVGASPAVVGVWCLYGVPESVRWLVARDAAAPDSASLLGELFRPPLRYRTLIGILLGAIPVIGTAANAQWIVPWSDQVAAKQRADQELATKQAPRAEQTAKPKPGKSNAKAKAQTVISRSSGAVVGSLLGGILATLLGRRLTYFLISLLSLCVSMTVFGWMNPADEWFQTAAFVFGLVGVVYFGWLPLYLPELFPTRVRATGTGISFNSGRAVAALVSLAAGALVQLAGGDYGKIGLWTSSIYAAGMLVILFAPRTDNSSLKG